MTHILRLDASMRKTGSQTRAIADTLIQRLEDANADASVTQRDLANTPAPFVDESWIEANFTDPDARTERHNDALAFSETLVDELEAADVVVIAAPTYNFSIPAALKAWIDMIARARRTFRYTETGPQGLLTGKKAYIIAVSGGTKAGSEWDFATPYLKHILAFIGITDVEIIAADAVSGSVEDAAKAQIDALFVADKAAA